MLPRDFPARSCFYCLLLLLLLLLLLALSLSPLLLLLLILLLLYFFYRCVPASQRSFLRFSPLFPSRCAKYSPTTHTEENLLSALWLNSRAGCSLHAPVLHGLYLESWPSIHGIAQAAAAIHLT